MKVTDKLTLVVAFVAIMGSSTIAETMLAMADKDFIIAATQGGMTEVILGEWAAKQGVRNDVKVFGRLMVKDHNDINNDLKTLTAQKGLILPDGLGAERQMLVDRLKNLTRTEFDDAYIAEMIKAHQANASAFQAEAAATKDPDIKTFVDKTLPILAAHLKKVTALKK